MSRSGPDPRFKIGSLQEHDAWVYDDDFGFDASLRISVTGDWLEADQRRYVEAVCAALNAADIPVRDDSQSDAKVNATLD